ncbi:NAD(P)/FAD-dependent oxidoreductase [Thermodesulfovibrio sp.]|uniref:NAD(P)/FAD-dependent oxidoreductase n=1 Tax=Thermodesulfovibrio sp. TaxID=2067987 RepID=UPI00309E1E8C
MKKLKVAIIGAGPAGISSAVEFKAEGISDIHIFEKGSKFCSTIRRLYPAGKRVDKDYKGVIASTEGICSFETETKEEFLNRMKKYINDYEIQIDYNIEINGLEKKGDDYVIKAGSFHVAQSRFVIIATGVFDKPKRPSYPIPEKIKDRVFFELPKELPEGEKILIVGGGNTAAEIACMLAGKCDVYLSYRRPQFFRINEENLKELEKRKDDITFFLGTEIKALEEDKDSVKVIFHDGHTEVFSKIFYCLGGSTPKNLLQKMGVEFRDNSPVIDEFGESNLERVFLVGDIATKRGSIINAFNSAHRAVKRIFEKYHTLIKS